MNGLKMCAVETWVAGKVIGANTLPFKPTRGLGFGRDSGLYYDKYCTSAKL
jgi:hypothetical protein